MRQTIEPLAVPATLTSLVADIDAHGIRIDAVAADHIVTMLATDEDPNTQQRRDLAAVRALRNRLAGHSDTEPLTVTWRVSGRSHALTPAPNLDILTSYRELLHVPDQMAAVMLDLSSPVWEAAADLSDDAVLHTLLTDGVDLYTWAAEQAFDGAQHRFAAKHAMFRVFFGPAKPATPGEAALRRLFPQLASYVDLCRELEGDAASINRLDNDRRTAAMVQVHALVTDLGLTTLVVPRHGTLVVAGTVEALDTLSEQVTGTHPQALVTGWR